jgi:hypothetical protein
MLELLIWTFFAVHVFLGDFCMAQVGGKSSHGLCQLLPAMNWRIVACIAPVDGARHFQPWENFVMVAVQVQRRSHM